jgi:hypothetical protein
MMTGLPGWWGARTTKAWVTPRPAETLGQLVIRGGFVVDDGRIRRLERRASDHGFGNLRGLWVPESRSWVLSCEFVGEAIGPR